MWRKASYLLAAVWLGGCSVLNAPEPSSKGPRTPTETQSPAVSSQTASAFNEAMTLLENLRYTEALSRLDRVVARAEVLGDKKRTAECRFWQGYCYEKQGMYPVAREMYQKAAAYEDMPAASLARQRMSLLPAPRVRGEDATRADLPRPSAASLSDLRTHRPLAGAATQPVPMEPEVAPPAPVSPVQTTPPVISPENSPRANLTPPPVPPQTPAPMPASAPARKSVLPPEEE